MKLLVVSTCVAIGVFLCVFPLRLEAQSATSVLVVRIVDETGAAIPQAAVRVEHMETRHQRQAEATSDGQVTMPMLPPGTYNVLVEHGGFAPARVDNVTLTAGNETVVQVELKVEALSEAVVVTAQKREERLQDVPIAMSVQSGEDIDRSGLLGVTDALQTMPGVVAFNGNYLTGGGTQLAIRGVGAASPVFSGASPIAYYLDSVPFGMIRTATVPDADPYDLQRIEVLRGPQGTLYGASAQGGVVRILTNDADLNKFEAKARGTFSNTTLSGSDNFRGNLAVNVPIVEGKLAARAVVSYQQNAGWIDRPGSPDANDSLYRTYRVKVNAKPTGALSIGMSLWKVRNHDGAPSIADENLNTGPGTLPESTRTSFDIYGVKLEYTSHWAMFTSSTSYIDTSNEGTLDLTIRGGALLNRAITSQLTSEVFAEEATVSSLPGAAWRWSAGLLYRDATDRTSQFIPGVYTAPNAFDMDSRSYAVFGEIGRAFAKGTLEPTVGLRYFRDRVSLQELSASLPEPLPPLVSARELFHSTSPRIALNYRPTPDRLIYASFSEGFRSGYPQSPSLLRIAPQFAPVKPDTLFNYEVGTKGDLFGRRLVYDAAVYYMHWQDVQQTLNVPIPGLNINATAGVNSESASGPGVDLGLTVVPISRLDLAANVSWNDLRLDAPVMASGAVVFAEGDRLNFSSAVTANGSAIYTLPLWGSGFDGKFSASLSYKSRQHVSPPFVVPPRSDAMIGIRGSVALVSRARWSATLYGENLSNQDPNIPPASSLEFTPHIRPRTVGLQLDYRF